MIVLGAGVAMPRADGERAELEHAIARPWRGVRFGQTTLVILNPASRTLGGLNFTQT